MARVTEMERAKGDLTMEAEGKERSGTKLSLALLGAGVFASAAVVGHQPGLGLPLAGVSVGAAVLVGRPRRPSATSVVAALLSLALLSFAAVLDAGWVLAVDLTFALFIGSYAVAGGETFTQVAAGCVAVFARLPRGMQIAFSPLEQPLRGTVRKRAGAYLPGVLVACLLVGVFGALLVTADPAFSRVAEMVLDPDLQPGLLPARIVVTLLAATFGGALVAAGRRGTEAVSDDPFGRASWKARRADWMIPLVALNALFAAFIAVQLTVLFGGRDYVLETTGLSYAEYARQGFFQLVLVSVLTLLVIAATIRWSAIDSRADRVMMRVLLGVLCVLTLALLGSALNRLSLYEAEFGLTRLRLSVHATILWLAGIFVLLIVAGALWKVRWLARSALFFTAIGLVAFSAANPDALIARQNVERFLSTGEMDASYLADLSADAVPALSELPEPLRSCMLAVHERRERESSWGGLNLARARAGEVFDRTEGDEPCPLPEHVLDVTAF